jgi:pimeloyl-ACP methyl ester carboxylesterase
MSRCMGLLALWLFLSSGVLGATANLDGIEVNWASSGDGNTIVFVHGWTCDMSVWEQQIAGFDD